MFIVARTIVMVTGDIDPGRDPQALRRGAWSCGYGWAVSLVRSDTWKCEFQRPAVCSIDRGHQRGDRAAAKFGGGGIQSSRGSARAANAMSSKTTSKYSRFSPC